MDAQAVFVVKPDGSRAKVVADPGTTRRGRPTERRWHSRSTPRASSWSQPRGGTPNGHEASRHEAWKLHGRLRPCLATCTAETLVAQLRRGPGQKQRAVEATRHAEHVPADRRSIDNRRTPTRCHPTDSDRSPSATPRSSGCGFSTRSAPIAGCRSRTRCGESWGRKGSNLRPRDYESPALTTELRPRRPHRLTRSGRA